MTGPRRLFVKFDVYGLDDIGDDFGLTASQRWVLEVLTRHADYRTHGWVGTIATLGQLARMERQTVSQAVGRLVEKGVVKRRAPFGPNRMGCLEVVCYDTLVVGKHNPTAANPAVPHETDGESTAQNAAVPGEPNRGKSRANRGMVASNAANAHTVSSDGATPRGIEIETTPNDAAKTQNIEADGHARNSKNGSVDHEIAVVDRFVDREIGAEFLGAL